MKQHGRGDLMMQQSVKKPGGLKGRFFAISRSAGATGLIKASGMGLAVFLASWGGAAADPLLDAITGGQVSLQMRPRYEFMQQAGKEDANAFTLRTLLGFSSKPLYGISADLQFINVAGIVNDYNSLRNGKTAYALIPDPEETNINQAFLAYTGVPGTVLRAGRQIINLDDQRFVGDVDFRQTQQTFDAVTLENRSLPEVQLYAAYAWRIKDIVNELIPARVFLAEATWTPAPVLHANVFGYWYGNQANSVIPGAVTCFLPGGPQACNDSIVGVRLAGSMPLPADFHLLYDASYAKQLPYDGGNSLVNAQYTHLGGGATWRDLGLHADYMLMGANSSGTYGFQTPLATRHAFNGWAEVFLVTPPKGLQSLYVTATAKVWQTALQATYYDFHSDTADLSYGNELDLSAIHTFTKHWSGGVQYADYRATGYGVNTQGAWVFVTAQY